MGDLRWYAQYGSSMNLWVVVVVNFFVESLLLLVLMSSLLNFVYRIEGGFRCQNHGDPRCGCWWLLLICFC